FCLRASSMLNQSLKLTTAAATNPHRCRIIRGMMAMLTSLFLSLSAFAQNATTPGIVKLMSTFECISVRASFSGDTDGDASATIKFRKTGTTSWKDAYPPVVDRRTTVNVQGTSRDNSANVNQARGSIVGLSPNTSYDVLVT